MATTESSGIEAIRQRARRVLTPATEADRKRRRIGVLSVPFLVLAAFGAGVPLVQMLRMSLSTSQFRIQGIDPSAYVELFASILAYVPVVGSTVRADPVFGEVIWNSLWFGAVTTAASVVVGIALAHALEKYDLPGEGLLVTLISFPISLPGIVAAFMMIVWFGETGLFTNGLWAVVEWVREVALLPDYLVAAFGTDPNAIALTGQPSGTSLAILGLFFGYLYSMIPRATFLLRGSYAEVNTDAEEAARALGATPWQTFRYVTLPQIRPGIVGAVILTFRTALAIFGTVLVLKALSVVTFRFDQELSVGFDLAMASALATVFFVFTLAFTFLGLRFTSAEVAG